MNSPNPLALGGWSTFAPPYGADSGQSQFSAFGALPGVTHASTFVFRFTNYTPTILDCEVITPGPHSNVLYYISTDGTVARTVVQSVAGVAVAAIDWRTHPLVEIYGTVPQQTSAQWLTSMPNRTRRMEFCGNQYIWSAHDNTITLFKCRTNTTPIEVMGRVTRDEQTIYADIILELSASALHLGLLAPAIVAIILFRCKRNID